MGEKAANLPTKATTNKSAKEENEDKQLSKAIETVCKDAAIRITEELYKRSEECLYYQFSSGMASVEISEKSSGKSSPNNDRSQGIFDSSYGYASDESSSSESEEYYSSDNDDYDDEGDSDEVECTDDDDEYIKKRRRPTRKIVVLYVPRDDSSIVKNEQKELEEACSMMDKVLEHRKSSLNPVFRRILSLTTRFSYVRLKYPMVEELILSKVSYGESVKIYPYAQYDHWYSLLEHGLIKTHLVNERWISLDDLEKLKRKKKEGLLHLLVRDLNFGIEEFLASNLFDPKSLKKLGVTPEYLIRLGFNKSWILSGRCKYDLKTLVVSLGFVSVHFSNSMGFKDKDYLKMIGTNGLVNNKQDLERLLGISLLVEPLKLPPVCVPGKSVRTVLLNGSARSQEHHPSRISRVTELPTKTIYPLKNEPVRSPRNSTSQTFRNISFLGSQHNSTDPSPVESSRSTSKMSVDISLLNKNEPIQTVKVKKTRTSSEIQSQTSRKQPETPKDIDKDSISKRAIVTVPMINRSETRLLSVNTPLKTSRRILIAS